MNLLRTTHSLVGVVTVVLLLSAVRPELRVALTAVDSPSLALLIPVLAFAGLITALTSAATALTVELAALILLGLFMAEDGGSALTWSGGIGLLAMSALCLVQLRLLPDGDD